MSQIFQRKPLYLQWAQNQVAFSSLVVFSATFLVLFLFQPFGEIRHEFQLLGIMRIVSYASASGLIFFVLLRFFPDYSEITGAKTESEYLSEVFLWCVGVIFTTSLAMFLIKNMWMEFTVFTIEDFGVVVWRVLCIALVPLLALMAFQRAVVLPQTEPTSVTLQSTDKNPVSHRFDVAEIMEIRSDENYVIVLRQCGSTIKETLLRNTLSRLEQELPRPFLRVHRSHIINMDKVQHVSLNTQSGYVILSGCDLGRDLKVPIGRHYLDSFKSHWQSYLSS